MAGETDQSKREGPSGYRIKGENSRHSLEGESLTVGVTIGEVGLDGKKTRSLRKLSLTREEEKQRSTFWTDP